MIAPFAFRRPRVAGPTRALARARDGGLSRADSCSPRYGPAKSLYRHEPDSYATDVTRRPRTRSTSVPAPRFDAPAPNGRPRHGSRIAIGLAFTCLFAANAPLHPATGDEPPPAPVPAPKTDPAAELKLFVDRVNKAIDDGQKFILSAQLEDGTWKGLSTPTTNTSYGEQALALLALAKTGVKPDHKQMQRGLAALDTLIGKQKVAVFNNEPHTHATYSAACVAMLLDALYAEHPTIGPDGKPTANKVKASLPVSATALLREIVTFFEAKRIDKAIVDGFGWLTANWSVTDNPGVAQSWHYDYLYGMERSCSLKRMRFVGSHDWYREGADVLLDAQKDGGDGPAVGGAQTRYAQTAFALLFLKRATSPTRFHAPAVTGGPDDEPTDGPTDGH